MTWKTGVALPIILLAGGSIAAAGDSRPVTIDAGLLAGITGLLSPYATAEVATPLWASRVSMTPAWGRCSGLQLNAGRVLRDEDGARHTIGVVWGRFHAGCSYRGGRTEPQGQYAGIAYDFQVKGFFIEVAPTFGARNPFASTFGRGPLTRVYGQVGYVCRLGRNAEHRRETS